MDAGFCLEGKVRMVAQQYLCVGSFPDVSIVMPEVRAVFVVLPVAVVIPWPRPLGSPGQKSLLIAGHLC